MASEITVDARLMAESGYFASDRRVAGLAVDMAGTGVEEHVQSVGFAAHEQIAINADIGTVGWAFFRNLDDTNYVEIGLDVGATFYPFAKLGPGEGGPSCHCAWSGLSLDPQHFLAV